MKKTCLSLIFCVIFNPFGFAQKLWNQKTNVPGGARNNATGFSVNGKGYMGLGQNTSGAKLYDFYEYDPSTNQWTQKANYPGAGSAGCTGFAINGKGYICFGVGSTGTYQKDLWEYNPTANTWTQKATFPGAGRYGSGCFVINDTAFLIGGNAGGSPYFSDVWMYIPATNTWTQKANYGGGSRCYATGFVVSGVGYAGTGITSATTARKDIWKYNKSKDTWSSIADYPLGAFCQTIGFGIDNKGYLGTGQDLTNFYKDMYQYDPTANTWTKLDSIPSSQSVRGTGVGFVINRTAYYGTGFGTTSATSLNDFWSYTPKAICSAYILTQPNSQSINQYDTAKFMATSMDTGASYKWQINTGSAFTDISNGGQYSGAKTKKLFIVNVKSTTNNGHKFRCIAIGKSCSDTSIIATLSVTCPTIFKSDATNQTGTVGGNIKFIVTALYSNTTFLWQKDDGTGFKNLTNSGQYYGFDNDTLAMSDLLYSNNNYKFRCLVTFDGCSSTSATANLTVNCKTIIKNQPSNASVYKGAKAIFVTSFLDAGTTFQWKTKIGSSFQNLFTAGQYKGTTTDSLSIYPTDMSNKNQQFKCILNYKGCIDSTKIISLDVFCNPLVSVNPQNQNKTEGANALFIVSSNETNTSFSWQINNGISFQNLSNSGNIIGTNNDSLTLINLILADNNKVYRCILSSGGCFDTSKNATLLVRCKSLLNTQPKNIKAFVSENSIISLVSLEPNASLAWQSDVGFGYQNLSNAGQYNGVNNDSLTISNISISNNNQKFRCILTLGACVETSEVATLQVICRTIISSQPINKSASIGGSAFFNVSVTESKSTFKWQSDVGFGFQNLSNAGQYKGVNKDTLTINDLTNSNNNQTFRCVINNGACNDTSNSVSLVVKSTGIAPLEQKGIIVFPNPCNHFINIKTTSELSNNSYKLIDQQGRIIVGGNLTDNNTKITIESLANGVYILQTEPIITRTLIIKN